MKRAGTFFLALTLGLFVAGSASAGYHEIIYDLTGSTLTTAQPLGTFVDPLTGTLVMRFGAVTSLAPITSAALVGGNTLMSLSQDSLPNAKITGTTNTILSPPFGGVAGSLGATTVTFPVITATVSGFLHCSGALCGAVGLPPVSVNQPVTGNAATFPPFVFPGGVAIGTTFAGTLIQTPQTGVVVTTDYVGTETDRMFFVPEPGTWMLGISGFATLALLCTLRLRRNG